MKACKDTTTGEVWIVRDDGKKAKKVSDLDALKWVGPMRESGSMRYLVQFLVDEVVE